MKIARYKMLQNFHSSTRSPRNGSGWTKVVEDSSRHAAEERQTWIGLIFISLIFSE